MGEFVRALALVVALVLASAPVVAQNTDDTIIVIHPNSAAFTYWACSNEHPSYWVRGDAIDHPERTALEAHERDHIRVLETIGCHPPEVIKAWYTKYLLRVEGSGYCAQARKLHEIYPHKHPDIQFLRVAISMAAMYRIPTQVALQAIVGSCDWAPEPP